MFLLRQFVYPTISGLRYWSGAFGEPRRDRTMATTERATSTIPVDTFRTSHDDFDEWITLFEEAVVLGTGVTDALRKAHLWKRWLPYKLDEEARIILRGIAAVEYADIKRELRKLLVDPQEAYNWQTNRTTVQWDGKESFHALVVSRAVVGYRFCQLSHS